MNRAIFLQRLINSHKSITHSLPRTHSSHIITVRHYSFLNHRQFKFSPLKCFFRKYNHVSGGPYKSFSLCAAIVGVIVYSNFDGKWYPMANCDASATKEYAKNDANDANGTAKNDPDNKNDEKNNDDISTISSHREHSLGFRESKIAAYEERLRRFSPAERVFRYFATVQINGMIYMTLDDFIRSLVPSSLQPAEYGLDRFKQMDENVLTLARHSSSERLKKIPPESYFGGMVYISYPEFLFLRTMMMTPMRNMDFLFKVYDSSGDGKLQRSEFVDVIFAISDQESLSHRTHVLRSQLSNSQLVNAMFGDKEKSQIDLKSFMSFVRNTKHELRKMEFLALAHSAGRVDSKLSEKQLVMRLTQHSHGRMARRFRTMAESLSDDELFDWHDWSALKEALESLNDMSDGLAVYATVQTCVDRDALIKMYKLISDEKLSPRMMSLLFKFLDVNDDGCVTRREFMRMMEHLENGGKVENGDMGFMMGIENMAKCMRAVIKGDLKL